MLLFQQEQKIIDRTVVVSVKEVRVCNTISMQSSPCTLHCVAVYCISIQISMQLSPWSVLQYVATCCSVLTQCVAVCCSMSCFSTTPMQMSPCSLYPYVALCCIVLQSITMCRVSSQHQCSRHLSECYSVSQCVAMRRSVL